jgi:tripeptidyl-peptidase I
MRLLLQVFALCSLVAGLSSRTDYVVHERRAVEPIDPDWVKTHRPNADKILSLRIGLAQQNLHELEEILMSVSHPDSPMYGKHWSRERVVEHFAPRNVTIDAVKAWLIDSGFHPDHIRVSPSKGWINVKATVSEVESLLDAEYHVYTHSSGYEQIS